MDNSPPQEAAQPRWRPGFAPKALNQILDQVQVSATSVIDAVAKKGKCDYVAEVAATLPLQMVCDMVGMHHQARPTCSFSASNVILGVGDPGVRAVDQGEDGRGLMTPHQNGDGDGQRVQHPNPSDDVASLLWWHTKVDGDRLTIPQFSVVLHPARGGRRRDHAHISGHRRCGRSGSPDLARALAQRLCAVRAAPQLRRW